MTILISEQTLDDLEIGIRRRMWDGENWDDISADKLLSLIAACRSAHRYCEALGKIAAHGYTKVGDQLVTPADRLAFIAHEALSEKDAHERAENALLIAEEALAEEEETK